GDFAVFLLQQLGLGAVVGLAVGATAAWGIARLPGSMAAFAPVASVGLAAVSFGAADVIGGSGFLAIYLVGLWVGNTPSPFRGVLTAFHQGLAYMAQVALFVVLGVLVFPSELGAVAAEGLVLAAVLIVLARPLAVVVSLIGQRFGAREQALVSWAGLRGAVPIVLATFPPTEGVAGSDTIFNAVFFVVIASALIQGPTLEPLASRLGLTSDEGPVYRPPLEVAAVEGADLVEYVVGPRDAVAGRRVRELGLPRAALVAVVVRGVEAIPPRGRTVVEPGDRLYVMVRAEARGDLERLLERWERGPLPGPPPQPAPATTEEPTVPGGAFAAGHRSLATASGAALRVAGLPDGSVTLGAGDSGRLRATLGPQQARALAEELIGGPGASPASAPRMRRTPLPGLGERIRIVGEDGVLILVVNPGGGGAGAVPRRRRARAGRGPAGRRAASAGRARPRRDRVHAGARRRLVLVASLAAVARAVARSPQHLGSLGQLRLRPRLRQGGLQPGNRLPAGSQVEQPAPQVVVGVALVGVPGPGQHRDGPLHQPDGHLGSAAKDLGPGVVGHALGAVERDRRR
ncbi:MAG TPA: cation:proton antiporter, partial [Miltoncostaeaceae bacterium]|nr:cation:proton antiporter [Miltoncostaeaceae bacterium]